MAHASRPFFLAAGTALTLVIALPRTLPAAPRPEPVQYTRTDLGSLGGESHAWFVNKHGQVAGISFALPHVKHAVLWDNGTIRDVGTLAGPQDEVTGLNDRGHVIGTRSVDSGETHAFLWTDGVLTDIGAQLGDFYSVAEAINNRGQVVGWSYGALGTRGFLWDNGSLAIIEPLPGGYAAFALLLNDAGQVAGTSNTALGEQHAFLWEAGRMTDISAGPGGAPCGCFASPNDLNARGQVVGSEGHYVPQPPGSDAFLWDDATGTKTIIATGGTDSAYSARHINDRGEISGTHRVGASPSEVTSAFYWRDGRLEEWNLGGGSLAVAAMNNDGRVVGDGRLATTELHGFTWSAGVISDLGGVFSAAADINDRGIVVGTAFFGAPGTHAAIWTPTGK